MLPSLIWSNAGDWDLGALQSDGRAKAAPGWTKRARKQGRVQAPPVRDFEGVVAQHAAKLGNLIHYSRLRAGEVGWTGAPRGVDPADGGLPSARAPRKRQQIQFLCRAVGSLARDGDVIVDFCSGSGHVGLPLAHLFPRCSVVLVDFNAVSMDIARRRVRAAGLTNVRVVEARVQDFTEAFDIGVGLHACGEATDLSIARCVDAGAAFVMCPCCVGKIKNSGLSYPRSEAVRQSLSKWEYRVAARAADYASWDGEAYSEREQLRRVCKSIVEVDRGAFARERGYRVELLAMEPLTASPKNDVLVAVPGGSTRRLPVAGVDSRPARVWLGALASHVEDGGTDDGSSPEEPACCESL